MRVWLGASLLVRTYAASRMPPGYRGGQSFEFLPNGLCSQTDKSPGVAQTVFIHLSET
jgi:hypothetical protein